MQNGPRHQQQELRWPARTAARPRRSPAPASANTAAIIITTGEFDWVLCNMQAVKPGVPIDNSGVTIQDGQPGGDDSAPNA